MEGDAWFPDRVAKMRGEKKINPTACWLKSGEEVGGAKKKRKDLNVIDSGAKNLSVESHLSRLTALNFFV